MHGEVVAVERLTPRMVRIVLGGDGLDDYEPTEFTDQYVNVLLPPEGAPYTVPFDVDEARAGDPVHRPVGRRYTIRAWDPTTRRVTIDFVVHGDHGTAGRWANRAEVGDLCQFAGPSGAYAPDPTADWHLLAGDESALPAIAAALEQVPEGTPAIAVVLVDDADHHLELTSPGDLTVHWVHRNDDPGNHDLLPEAVEALELPAGRPHVFVHGEAGETRAIRKHLLGERGIAREHTSISPYWRRDFTDEKWREVKRDWLAEVEQDV
ncbi:MAG: siderophore-interacting protein [Actinomycetota bacterium]|nr:siderophore-interacting protein [Actinomycetota bacterium]